MNIRIQLWIYRCFEKPFDVNRLYSSLDKAMEYIDGAYVDVFIYSNKEHKRVLVDDIIYMENKDRKTYFYTTQGNFLVRDSLEEWKKRLPTTFFIKIKLIITVFCNIMKICNI